MFFRHALEYLSVRNRTRNKLFFCASLNKKNRACILASPAKRFHFKEKFNFLFYDKRFSLADNIKDNRCQKYKSLNNLLNILVNTHNTHT